MVRRPGTRQQSAALTSTSLGWPLVSANPTPGCHRICPRAFPSLPSFHARPSDSVSQAPRRTRINEIDAPLQQLSDEPAPCEAAIGQHDRPRAERQSVERRPPSVFLDRVLALTGGDVVAVYAPVHAPVAVSRHVERLTL